MITELINLLKTSPEIALGLFFMGFLLLILFGFFVNRLIYPNDGKTKVFGDELAHWPYEPLQFMTDSEVEFYERLQLAVDNYYHIFCQVQLSRIINAENHPDSGQWLNRINRMSVDFLLVDYDAKTPLIVIELDDWSHEAKERIRADAKKDKALSCAGIPVMRFHGEQMPSSSELAKEINKVISQNYS